MKKETIYKIAIGILLALNVLQLLGFLFSPKPEPPQHSMGVFEDKAVKLMHLTQVQQQDFLKFIQEHKAKMRRLRNAHTELTSTYFTQPSDSLLKLITKVEREKIETTEQHFADIKSILHKEQIPSFEQFKAEVLQKILNQNTPEPPRRHRKKKP